MMREHRYLVLDSFDNIQGRFNSYQAAFEFKTSSGAPNWKIKDYVKNCNKQWN